MKDLPPRQLRTERLLVRRWKPEQDAQIASNAINDSLEHLRPFMSWATERPSAADQLVRLRESEAAFDKGDDCAYGIWLAGKDQLAGSDQLVGSCGLHRRGAPESIDIGYWIHVDHVGNGYATEVAVALGRAAMELPGIQWVEIHCDEANKPSIRVAEKAGFVLETTWVEKPEAPGRTGRMQGWVKR